MVMAIKEELYQLNINKMSATTLGNINKTLSCWKTFSCATATTVKTEEKDCSK
jgi:hypothetical protein